MPSLDWFSGFSLVTAPISQPHCPLKYALGLGVGSKMAFTFNNLCPDWVEELKRQVNRGEPPITCQHCRGQFLIIPSLLASIHVIYLSHHLSFVPQITNQEEVWRGYMYINMSKIDSLWIPLLVQTSLFGSRQRWLLCVCQPGHSSLHQWHAIQKISISWQPTPLTPPLPPGVSRLHFRSWQLVITLDSRRA